jgi:hypothetical protein
MARGRLTILAVSVALAGTLATAPAFARDTENQLLQRIQSEQNPVKKAKAEVRLADLKLAQIQDAYAGGKIEDGVKLLGVLTGTMQTSWKILQDSGRVATKHPEGYRDLEISLREEMRVLQDLSRTVSYFDRAPVENAVQELDQLHGKVIRALFPGGTPRTIKGSQAPTAETSPGTTTEAR